jgi:phosphoribosyl 1,2-cyclic phosphodiesterase
LVMKLTFAGTRGYIEARTERHRMHASCRVSSGRGTIIIDVGEDWVEEALDLDADAILLTHAHPDHAWGLKRGAPCPVYATEDTWEALRKFPVEEKVVVIPGVSNEAAGFTFEAFTVEHSTRAPAVGYRVSDRKSTFFYAPDLVYIHDRARALGGAGAYVGDGATVARPMVRKRGESLIGHVPVQTQLTWCKKEGVPLAVFTHCGSQIVAGDEEAVIARIKGMAQDRGVEVVVAYDGMQIEIQPR